MAISNSDKVIDSRDVIDRIRELESERELLIDALDEARHIANNPEEGDDLPALEEAVLTAEEELRDWDNDSDQGGELQMLRALADEAEHCGDWDHGATLIHEDFFIEYCQEMLQDIGDLPREIPHYIVIDWEATADNLKADYSEVTYGDQTYYIRD